MKVLVIGGSGSGKSEYAEELALKLKKDRVYYIACMIPYGDEGIRRVKRHRKMREGKGFITIEQYRDIYKIKAEDTVIIECVSNLLANEMFGEHPKYGKYVLDTLKSIKAENVIFVTDNVFDDGIEYDDATIRYMEELSYVNKGLGEYADKVVEIVCGIAKEIKRHW